MAFVNRAIHGGMLLLVLLLLDMPLPAHAYVLMGEHVLDRTVEALGAAASLEVSQTVTLHATDMPLPGPLNLQETVRLKPTGAFRSDAAGEGRARSLLFTGGTALMAVDGVLAAAPPPRFTRYHDVLVLKSRPALVDYLQRLGVDVSVSSLGRYEDQYCYVVGARFPDEDAPQLWVAKDTFLPFRLILPPAADLPEDGPVEIRYRNWTFAGGAAYPMHMVMLQRHQVMQEVRGDRITTDPVSAGAPFDPDAFRRQYVAPAAILDPERSLPPNAVRPPAMR